MWPYNQTTLLCTVVLYGVAVGTAWTLLGVPYNDHAAFCLLYKHYSVGVSNMTVLGLLTAFPHLVTMHHFYVFRRLIGVITDYCFTTNLTCLCCCIPRWWWVGIVECRPRKTSLSALEHLRIEIQAPSNSKWCVIIPDLLVEEVTATVLNRVLKYADSC